MFTLSRTLTALCLATATLPSSWAGCVTPFPAAALDAPRVRLSAANDRLGNPADPNDRRSDIYAYRLQGRKLQRNIWLSGGNWSGWLDFATSPTIFDTRSSSLVAFSGWDNTLPPATNFPLPRYAATFGFDSRNDGIDIPDQVGLATAFNSAPASHGFTALAMPNNANGNSFDPVTAFTRHIAGRLVINVFGAGPTLGRPAGVSLRELFFDGQAFKFGEHGWPPGASVLRLGPDTAVWDQPSGRAWVFASADASTLFSRNWNMEGCPNAWCWESLGAPETVTQLRTPVAVRVGAALRVFVAGQLPNDDWALFSRQRIMASGGWGPWQAHGTPPNLFTSLPGIPAGNLKAPGHGFDLRTAMVWRDPQGHQRVNIFGTADPINCLTSGLPTHQGGHLVEFMLDGLGAWGWGGPTQLGQTQSLNLGSGVQRPDFPVRVQATRALVVQPADRSFLRLSLLASDEFGRSWEYLWDDGAGWKWNELR